MMEKFFYPNHPVRCIITGHSKVGNSIFLTNSILNIFNENDGIYIYSPPLHQDLYQKLFKCFTNYIPLHIITNILNEEDTYKVIDEMINNKVFEKTGTEIETIDSKEELGYPQDYENNSIVILNDLIEKQIINDKILAMFKRGRHDKLSVFIISQDYYELPKRTIRANGNIYHIFKPNIFRDVQNLY